MNELPSVITYPTEKDRMAIIADAQSRYYQRAARSGVFYDPPEERGSTKAWYAYRIINHLIENGFVDYQDFANVLAAEAQASFNAGLYAERFSVIADYALTGGVNTFRRG